MHYFFFGEDFYSIKQKVESFKKRFAETDPSGINISEVDGTILNFSQFFNLISAMPFLASKRLIIIKNILQNKDNDLKKKIANDLSKIPETSIVIFVEFGTPDARGALFKALNQPKIAQKFNLLVGIEFRNWVTAKLQENNAIMNQEALFLFEQYLLGDLFRAENEIKKLVSYKKTDSIESVKIDASDIEKLVAKAPQSDIFEFIDSLSNKNVGTAVRAFNKLIVDGQNELYIFTMIVYQYRNLLIVSDLLQKKIPAPEIQKISKLHPFVIKKTLALLNKYDFKTLSNIYFLLQENDFKIKSGKLDAKLMLPCLIQKLA